MTSLRKKVAKDVLERIRTGEFSKDTVITEAKICETMSLSRTPAREALIELTANGILEKVPRKGYRIRELDEKDKTDIYAVLANLDALAAREAAEHMTDSDFLHMNELIDLMDIAIKYKNYANYCELQERFHNVYINRCNNSALIKTLDDIKASITRYTYYSTDEEKLFRLAAEMNDEHRHILELFQNNSVKELIDFLENVHWITKDTEMI